MILGDNTWMNEIEGGVGETHQLAQQKQHNRDQ